MTKQLVQTFVSRYMPDIGTPLELVDDAIFKVPVQWLAGQIVFEGSRFEKSQVRIWYGCQPLFVPIECVTLSHCEVLRLGSNDYHDLASQDVALQIVSRIINDAIPRINVMTQLDRFEEYLLPIVLDPLTSRVLLEPFAYLQILRGDDNRASEWLGAAEMAFSSEHRFGNQERLERTMLVREALGRSRADAVSQLMRWSEFTATHLKISHLLDLPEHEEDNS